MSLGPRGNGTWMIPCGMVLRDVHSADGGQQPDNKSPIIPRQCRRSSAIIWPVPVSAGVPEYSATTEYPTLSASTCFPPFQCWGRLLKSSSHLKAFSISNPTCSKDMSSAGRNWWKHGVVYQVWPASYKDSNGDGVGDFSGIISTLDYLKDLGVDILWISPAYESPQYDMGYDISDYEDIYHKYGTLADTEKLIQGCHDREMRIIFDLVINHTSNEHAWFRESRSSKTNRSVTGTSGAQQSMMKMATGSPRTTGEPTSAGVPGNGMRIHKNTFSISSLPNSLTSIGKTQSVGTQFGRAP